MTEENNINEKDVNEEIIDQADGATEMEVSSNEDSSASDAEDEKIAKNAFDDDSVYDESDDNAARWYVIHTYSGHENKVKANIEKIVQNHKNEQMAEYIQKITVPTHDVTVQKDNQSKIKSRKMFPGYVLIKMIVTSESWYLVRNTQGVTGFIGEASKPVPLTKEEVRRMGIEKVYIELDIEVGDSIKVINGPFKSFTGIVEEVYPEKEILKARISMFGRDTPVELIYDQVDKLYK